MDIYFWICNIIDITTHLLLFEGSFTYLIIIARVQNIKCTHLFHYMWMKKKHTKMLLQRAHSISIANTAHSTLWVIFTFMSFLLAKLNYLWDGWAVPRYGAIFGRPRLNINTFKWRLVNNVIRLILYKRIWENNVIKIREECIRKLCTQISPVRLQHVNILYMILFSVCLDFKVISRYCSKNCCSNQKC